MDNRSRLICFAFLSLGACSSTEDPGGGVVPGAKPANAQLPPTGAEAVGAWLAKGEYKSWNCEATPHEARSPSPHGTNRICSNELLSAHGAGEFPVDAAAVKEIYESGNVTGYAVYRKVTSGGGDAWYWYESLDGRIVADGVGTTGKPKDVCASCHSTAGTDGHTGHDYVFTQVR